MQKAIRVSKFVALVGIALNVLLLIVMFVFYHGYFDEPWMDTALDVLYALGLLAQVMTFGGIIVKSVLDYRAGGPLVTRAGRIVVAAVLAVVIGYQLLRIIL